jgi:hypothetical protein
MPSMLIARRGFAQPDFEFNPDHLRQQRQILAVAA